MVECCSIGFWGTGCCPVTYLFVSVVEHERAGFEVLRDAASQKMGGTRTAMVDDTNPALP